MKFSIILILSTLITIQANAQSYRKIDSIINVPAVLEEFKLLNLCHCIEYMEINGFENASPKFLIWNEKYIYSKFNSGGLNNQYYDSFYRHSIFFKYGVSAYFEKKFDYGHLDSLYYQSIVLHYKNITLKREGLYSNKGLADYNAFFACYFKLKEIPLKEELQNFLIRNNNIIKY